MIALHFYVQFTQDFFKRGCIPNYVVQYSTIKIYVM